MAYRELELTLLSARDLKNVNLFMSMDVYAVASISGDPMTRQCTPTDTSGGRNPSWDTTLRFSVPPGAAEAGGGWLHVLLRSERALGDRDVGEVVVPLAELLAVADGPGPQPPRLASYQVHTVHRGEPRGVLNVSYRLGPVVAPVEKADDKPTVIAYPAPQQNFMPQNPASPQPYHPPQYGYAPQREPYHPPRDAYAPQPQPYHLPHDPYAPPPPRPVEALSPANGKGNGHGPTQVYMGPHTQIIFGGAPTPTPRSNTIPAKTDGPRLKPSYTPIQPNTIPGKTDQSWPKASPKMPDRSTRPQHDDTKLGELAHTQSKIGLGKTNGTQVGEYASIQSNIQPGKADSTRPKEAYGNSWSNSTPGKADHQSGHKVVMQHERVPSLPIAAAR